MAVYEQAFGPYDGPLTPAWSRFLILPRHAIRSIFRSKLVTGYFALMYVPPLIFGILIYLHHNVNALAIFHLDISELLSIDKWFFQAFLAWQFFLGFLLVLFVAPPLVAKDLTNNGLPLYLSRPFTRTEYVVGKMSILVILLSAVTWVPGVILFLLQSFLDGMDWFLANARIGVAIILGAWVWILVMSLLALAISALVRWNIAARAAFFAIFIIPQVFGAIVNDVFDTRWGLLFSLPMMFENVLDGLFATPSPHGLPGWCGWVVLGFTSAVCLALLARKVRAYEVVR